MNNSKKSYIVAALGILFFWSAAAAAVTPRPIRMEVDEVAVSNAGGEIRLPRSTGNIVFSFGSEGSSSSSKSGRMRYKLEGYDAEWHGP